MNFQIVNLHYQILQDPTDAAPAVSTAEALLQGEILEFSVGSSLLADDLAGYVTGRLVEGAEVGQTDILVIETDEPDRLTANLNSGSRSTGRIRGERYW